jgi:predicted TIM-barrel fold metal-dependent hydrolase
MSRFILSRRDALRRLGTLAAGVIGFGLRSDPRLDAADRPPADTSLIDMHVHIVNTRIPGLLETPVPLAPFDKIKDPQGMERLVKTIEDQAKTAGVGQALCMPRCEVSDQDPLGIRDTLALAQLVRECKIHAVGLVHPERFDVDHLARVEDVLKEGKVKALKVYLGYLHYEPYHAGYRPYYKLAAKYKVPVIFHCGDTFSRMAKVKYAHPLKIDEVVVDFPDTRFVLAHFGNPWILDAAQVVYKNKNAWADLSGIVTGDEKEFAEREKDGVLGRTRTRIKEGIEYVDAPEKFLYGSDWPLTPMIIYRDFVRQLFPEKHHQAVFRDNARTVFGL